MKSLALVFLSWLAFVSLAQAQGSSYNLLGFGTPVIGQDPVTSALGGASTALGGARAINPDNPADWTWLRQTRFEASLRSEYANSTLGDQQGAYHGVQFSGFMFAAPFWDASRAVLAIGYLPITNASSQIDIVDSVAERSYSSIGGVNLGFIGAALRPTSALSVGARIDLIAGNIRHVANVIFATSSTSSSVFERDYYFYGLRPTIGLQLIGDSLSLPGLTLGATLNFATPLTSTRESIYTPSSNLDTSLSDEQSGEYPMQWSAGLAYRLGGRYRVLADFSGQDFTSALLFGAEGSADPDGAPSSRISVGIERVENINNQFGMSDGLDRWALRAGAYYATLPISPIGTGGVHEAAVSVGVGIPIGIESMLNFSVTGGQRSPADAGTAPNESFVRLGASISLSERWFVPTRRQR